MNSSKIVKYFLVECIVVVLIAAYFLIDSSDLYRWWVGDTQFATLSLPCDLHHKRCELSLKDDTPLSFEIDPKSIPLMQPPHFKVTTPHELSSIELKIFATNMNMGFHTFVLKPTAKGVYEGSGILPTCAVGNMIWQANVILNKSDRSLGAVFTFQTDK
ncbi:hypothetical protein [Sulfurospirillum cavolei]|uniref:hypothetical protein n=1 Tax=Sulfurospirillum cavolei TaxID=366522 RepID=UPI003FA1E611